MVDFDETQYAESRDFSRIHKDPLAVLNEALAERRKQRDFVTQQTAKFVELFFSAFKTVVQEAREKGMTELGEPRMIDHPAGKEYRALQIPIEDWSVVFVPIPGAARPNIKDEAQIPGFAFRNLCGRIAVFIGTEPDTIAFYDILILSSGAWFAWGYGWPHQADNIESTNFKGLAAELLASFVRDIRVTWRIRGETKLGQVMDAKRRVYLFGLPGDDQAG
jgi:hypothetical protein